MVFGKCSCVHILRWGGGSEKVYVFYTHLNVDNYEQPLNDFYINYLNATHTYTTNEDCIAFEMLITLMGI